MSLSDEDIELLRVASLHAVYSEAPKMLGMREGARRAATTRAPAVLFVLVVAWAESGKAPDEFVFAVKKKALAAMVMAQSRHGSASSDYRNELHLLTGTGLLAPVESLVGEAYRVNVVRVLEAGSEYLRQTIANVVADLISHGDSKEEAQRYGENISANRVRKEYDRLAEKIRRLFP